MSQVFSFLLLVQLGQECFCIVYNACMKIIDCLIPRGHIIQLE